MALGEMTTEKWLLGGAAVATIAFLAVAVLQPSLFDAEPDWGVSEGCIGGQTSHTAGEDIGIKFHYHPNLKVIVDGQQLSIDPNTGIDQMGCRGDALGPCTLLLRYRFHNSTYRDPIKNECPTRCLFRDMGEGGGACLDRRQRIRYQSQWHT